MYIKHKKANEIVQLLMWGLVWEKSKYWKHTLRPSTRIVALNLGHKRACYFAGSCVKNKTQSQDSGDASPRMPSVQYKQHFAQQQCKKTHCLLR